MPPPGRFGVTIARRDAAAMAFGRANEKGALLHLRQMRDLSDGYRDNDAGFVPGGAQGKRKCALSCRNLVGPFTNKNLAAVNVIDRDGID